MGKRDYWFAFKEGAFNHKHKISWSYVGTTEPFSENLRQFFDVKLEDYPVLAGVRPKDMAKFKYKYDVKEMNIGDILDFADYVLHFLQ